MELEDWQLERIDKSVEFLLEIREKYGRKVEAKKVINVEIPDDISNKNIVIKASNAILKESGTEFIAILLVNQCDHQTLLSELFDVIQPENFSKTFFVDELIANPITNKLVPKYKLAPRRCWRDCGKNTMLPSNLYQRFPCEMSSFDGTDGRLET